MQSTRSKQIVLFLLVCGLVAFFFVNGRNNSTALSADTQHASPAMKEKAEENTFRFEELEKSVLAGLEPKPRDSMQALVANASKAPKNAAALKRVAVAFDSLRQPAMAGRYYRMLAEMEPTAENWRLTGGAFYAAMSAVADPEKDAATVRYFASLATESLEKSLKADPKNLDTKAELAAVNVALDPYTPENETMVGIGLLREIIQTDPDNRKALLMLGVLSMQSGQWDKAIERFTKLANMDGSQDRQYPYYFRFLGQAYAGAGQKDKAVEAWKRYKSLVSGQPAMMKDADELIRSAQEHDHGHDHEHDHAH